MKNRIPYLLSAAALIVAAPSAFAYDYNVCNRLNDKVGYVHLDTVSALCHDRTPVDVNAGDAPLLLDQCVSGTTAPGCLVSGAEFYTQASGSQGWSNGLGMMGGTWTLNQYGSVCMEEGAGYDTHYTMCQGGYTND